MRLFLVTSQPTPDSVSDPTLAIAERQLVLLGELAVIVMVAARAFGSSAVDAAEAEKMILAEQYFTPEVGRARACGARDAAESLQKVARAARLTMKLQMAVAEIVRDIRAGVVTHSHDTIRKDASETPADLDRLLVGRRFAGSEPADRDSDCMRSETNTAGLVEFERPETFPLVPFRETVDTICADVGATVDWTRWKIEAPTPSSEALEPHRLKRSSEPAPASPLPP